jgi:hypothetical protein
MLAGSGGLADGKNYGRVIGFRIENRKGDLKRWDNEHAPILESRKQQS